jgi:hypothetical protein
MKKKKARTLQENPRGASRCQEKLHKFIFYNKGVPVKKFAKINSWCFS